MPAFEYQALDKLGNTHKGVLEGDTARQVRQKLRNQNLIPLSINEVINTKTKKYHFVSITASDLALITRQLTTLIRAGLALEEVLQAVAEQTEKPRLKSILLAVRSKVLEGHSLAESLNDFPKIFPSVYRATIAAGEQSGQLDLVLERLAQYTENRQQLRQKTLLALFYPALLTIVAILVVIGLLTYVVPQVVQVFNNINQDLPWLTIGLIRLSNFLQNFGIWILVLLITIVFSIRYLLKYNKILFIYHNLLLRLPLISRFERGMNIARFTRTLSILTASGVPVLQALNITSQVISNQIIRQAIEQATKKLNEGSNLNTALKQSGLFPPMTIYLIASGEASGELEAMLEHAAIIQEQELETLVAVILSLFEPLLILIMGGIVLIIVLAILMPIFEINQLVR